MFMSSVTETNTCWDGNQGETVASGDFASRNTMQCVLSDESESESVFISLTRNRWVSGFRDLEGRWPFAGASMGSGSVRDLRQLERDSSGRRFAPAWSAVLCAVRRRPTSHQVADMIGSEWPTIRK
jgi:hypothetical protein